MLTLRHLHYIYTNLYKGVVSIGDQSLNSMQHYFTFQNQSSLIHKKIKYLLSSYCLRKNPQNYVTPPVIIRQKKKKFVLPFQLFF